MFLKALGILAMVATVVSAVYGYKAYQLSASQKDLRDDVTNESGATKPTTPLSRDAGNRRLNQAEPVLTAQNCNATVHAGRDSGPVTLNCPNNAGGGSIPRETSSPGGPGGHWRGGDFIPICPPGMGYSLEHRQCVLAQYIGGVIPCSADDAPNCGPYVSSR